MGAGGFIGRPLYSCCLFYDYPNILNNQNIKKTMTLQLKSCLLALLLTPGYLFAQPEVTAATNLEKINDQMVILNQKYIIYVSEMAHGKAKKAEKKHADYLNQITNFRYALIEIPYYKGDKSLHEGVKKYLKMVETIQREDYTKIVNMEEIAEQSYDAMEAYILFKDKIDEKMDEVEKEYDQVVADYCSRNNIILTEADKTEQSNKMDMIGKVSDYQDEVYLIFFKASIHDEQLVDAMDKGNLTAVEQIKGSLLKYSLEGLGRLDTLRSFKGDGTLKNSCRRALEFFKKEAASIDSYTDYMLKKEDFEAIKKNFERNAKAKSDKAEIDKYNAAVAELNKSSDKFNKSVNEINRGRSEAINDWNNTVNRFFDTHIPYSK